MQLLETIRVEKGEVLNILFHQDRMNNSRKELFKCTNEIDLPSVLQDSINNTSINELSKCRIIYNTSINKVEFIPYFIPKICSLKLIECDDIDYSYKYLNRDTINKMMNQRADADDIIIVKNGFITDSSFANLLFYNGDQWLTPTFPLLKGTQRAKLLEQEKVRVVDIRPEDLHNFQQVRLVNAMLRFEDEVDVIIDKIC